MKLSTKKELLKEADIVLSDIKKSIKRKNISENTISNFFSDLIKSIAGSISMWLRTNRQENLYKKIPYLVGIDLINNRNIKIDKVQLDKLEKLVREIINEIKSSPELKAAIKELEKADEEWRIQRGAYQTFKKHPELQKMSKGHAQIWKTLPDKERSAKKKYYTILNDKISKIVFKILTGTGHKTFQERILTSLQSGIQGLSKEELGLVKNNYFKIVSDRVSNYVDKYEVAHQLTSSEVYDYYSSGDGEGSAISRKTPYGWSKIYK